jgi:hypothetical protein
MAPMRKAPRARLNPSFTVSKVKPKQRASTVMSSISELRNRAT